jgi:putative redox protein
MSSIVVSHLVGDQFEVAIRDHRLRVDQPLSDGGQDTAPTPTELFVSSLATCVAFYARRYLARHDLPTNGLGLEARYELATRPNRVGTIAISLRVPHGVPEDKWPALLAVARHCTVHNSLEAPPAVSIELAAAQRAAA